MESRVYKGRLFLYRELILHKYCNKQYYEQYSFSCAFSPLNYYIFFFVLLVVFNLLLGLFRIILRNLLIQLLLLLFLFRLSHMSGCIDSMRFS